MIYTQLKADSSVWQLHLLQLFIQLSELIFISIH